MLISFLLLIAGFVMLIKGADLFVDGSSGIAQRMGISQLIIGLTFVAMGTSAPEAAISISAAMKGSADITIGNVVGSNIMNVLVILGVTAAITALKVEKSTIRIELPFMLAISLLLMLMGLDGVISLLDGIGLATAFSLYLAYLFWSAKKGAGSDETEGEAPPVWKSLVMSAIGLVLIVYGSDVTVDAAIAIAKEFGISDRIIGLTIVALGTSLPELFTCATAARKGCADIAIGNIVGSNIFNILFVVGLSALVIPVPFAEAFMFDMQVAIISAGLLYIFCRTRFTLERWEGFALLACYGAYLFYII